jgi:hypothetical protein
MSDDAKIDLSRYQTREIASRVAEILSVPGSVRTVVGTTLAVIILLGITNTILYMVSSQAIFPGLVSSIYALVIATILGFGLGLLRVTMLLIQRSESLMQLTLETSREVAKDVQEINRGGKNMPDAAQIVEHVYDGVIVPAMEASVAQSFGFVGTPLLWIYRRTIGGGIRYLITRIKTSTLSDDEATEIEHDTQRAMRDITSQQNNIEWVVKNSMSYTKYASGLLKKFLLRPAQLIFAIIAIAAVIPLILCWCFTF